MERLWSRIGIRVASVGLLVGGLAGGVHVGRQHQDQALGDRADSVAVDAAEIRLLKERHGRHAAARAHQREAEDEAAAKAGAVAQVAAGNARMLDRKVVEKKADEKRRAEAKKAGTVPYDGPIPSSCNEFSGNRKIGCALMIAAGFPISQFGCLNKLWTKESGWNHRARNPSSGAYGIPQSYPGSKMSSVAADWQTNPATQIKWGLGYIKGRYQTPCGAWSRSESTGSY
ncbi:lytic transglycosylase domain-containing protein [Actinoplanes sp. NPDC049599]|uniref:aggregation-promoting factor C-terminal-like domain-containing protein n=1 Tax=Actinoplanes sp. NPDC049599 TaxID=3363903 RepID=UPI0037938768